MVNTLPKIDCLDCNSLGVDTFYMDIIDIKILRGPNYWSNYRKKLIVFKINLQDFETKPSNTLPNFNSNLKELLPSLQEHCCSYHQPGGFFKRCEEGTWMGHIMEHVALELQSLAGMKCGFGRTRSASTVGVYHVIFSYLFEEAGVYAGQAAFNLVKALAHGEDYKELANDIKQLELIYNTNKFGPSTQSIIDEIERRHIPYTRIADTSLIILGQGKNQQLVRATETSLTSVVGTDLARDKALTKHILQSQYIPVPNGVEIFSVSELEQAIENIGFPIVIKPHNANHGRGITTNITTLENAILAFNVAKKHSRTILVEKYVLGDDYRFLVVNYKLIAVAKRLPAKIIGDGKSSIQELIDQVNQNPLRGMGHENMLTQIAIDKNTMKILEEKSYTLHTILNENEELALKYTANLSSGGTAEDVTDSVHPTNRFLAERIARLVNLNLCGIDIIAQDITQPITLENGGVIEVNSGPGLRMHLSPTLGKKRNVAASIVDMLFPNNNARIPIVAITGTNGKTTVVRLLAHVAKQQKFQVGFTTTEGIYIDGREVFRGDCSGPASAGVILRDPWVDFAVLESARGGILRSGLGFDHCNVGIVTNVSEDHLGLSDIHTLEDLARVKSVVPRSVFKDGYAVLNADDKLVYEMREDLNCNIALFSFDKNNPHLIKHIEAGGLAAYVDNNQIYIARNKQTVPFINVTEIPITYSAQARSMVQNILPVVLTAYALNFDSELVHQALLSFMPNAQHLPGRMNIYNIHGRRVMLDYAHNVGAFLELKNYLKNIKAPKKTGIIAATGDRRDVDIIGVGNQAAEIFDEIIIRHDLDSRGRTHQVLDDLLKKGIQQVKPNIKITIVPNEFEAIDYAIATSVVDGFIFYFPDKVLAAVKYLEHRMNEPHFEKEVSYES